MRSSSFLASVSWVAAAAAAAAEAKQRGGPGGEKDVPV